MRPPTKTAMFTVRYKIMSYLMFFMPVKNFKFHTVLIRYEMQPHMLLLVEKYMIYKASSKSVEVM